MKYLKYDLDLCSIFPEVVLLFSTQADVVVILSKYKFFPLFKTPYAIIATIITLVWTPQIITLINIFIGLRVDNAVKLIIPLRTTIIQPIVV